MIAEGLEARLRAIEQRLVEAAPRVAIYLVFDRPERVEDRPGIQAAYFAERCLTDLQIEHLIAPLREVGCYVELIEGDLALVDALASGRLAPTAQRPAVLIYNGVEGGVTRGGFRPGRKALVPVLADAYGLPCANSPAHGCALGRHKFHYFTLLRALGVRTPRVWHYRPADGWANGHAPAEGTKVIAKSTYESWAVGVTQRSAFFVDDSTIDRVPQIAEEIRQAVTVQEFISGAEVCVPVFADPRAFATTPVQVVLARSARDPDAFLTIDDNLEPGGVAYERFDGSRDVRRDLAGSAVATHDALELECFSRIDFRVDDVGDTWVIDVGVSPGVVQRSSAFASVAQETIDHGSFIRIVMGASLISRQLI
ncbi:MAG TPA: hypothetical protein VF364_05915 [Candidatus Limnocylindria bacterium]